jgi:hypothetical protein
MTQPIEPQVTVYFSFGHGQTDPTTGKNLLDHYVTIVGPSYEACRAAMFASNYGDRWAFDYIAGEPQAEEWIPRWTEHERIVLPVACSEECAARPEEWPCLDTCPAQRAARGES